MTIHEGIILPFVIFEKVTKMDFNKVTKMEHPKDTIKRLREEAKKENPVETINRLRKLCGEAAEELKKAWEKSRPDDDDRPDTILQSADVRARLLTEFSLLPEEGTN